MGRMETPSRISRKKIIHLLSTFSKFLGANYDAVTHVNDNMFWAKKSINSGTLLYHDRLRRSKNKAKTPEGRTPG